MEAAAAAGTAVVVAQMALTVIARLKLLLQLWNTGDMGLTTSVPVHVWNDRLKQWNEVRMGIGRGGVAVMYVIDSARFVIYVGQH